MPKGEKLENRYRIAFLDKGKLLDEELVDSLAEAKQIVSTIRRNDPTYIKRRDINIEDQVTGTTWTVDPNYRLVEM